MAVRDALGPFQPGPGGMPPYLAGREREHGLLRALLARLRDRLPLASEVILHGPRGNGKTVLLGWLEDEAASMGGIETKVLLPGEISDPAQLAERLAPRRWWRALVPRQLAAAGFGGTGSAESEPQLPRLARTMAARARRTPTLVVMDEAHAVARMLLHASQRVRTRHPFLLVLAGTPNLRGHLAAMGASSWDRAEQLRIGRRDETATRGAVRRPFEAEGIRVEEEALTEIVRLSHGYPYFIQLLGRAAWRQVFPARGVGSAVTAAALEVVRRDFERTKATYYRRRLSELAAGNLLSAARSVAAAFRDREVLGDLELVGTVRAGIVGPEPEGGAEGAALALGDLGFVWETDAPPGWEPGIPSLMHYILEFTPAP